MPNIWVWCLRRAYGPPVVFPSCGGARGDPDVDSEIWIRVCLMDAQHRSEQTERTHPTQRSDRFEPVFFPLIVVFNKHLWAAWFSYSPSVGSLRFWSPCGFLWGVRTHINRHAYMHTGKQPQLSSGHVDISLWLLTSGPVLQYSEALCMVCFTLVNYCWKDRFRKLRSISLVKWFMHSQTHVTNGHIVNRLGVFLWATQWP